MTSSWRDGITGKGIIVAILDDGIDYTHPDLINNFVSSLSYRVGLIGVGQQYIVEFLYGRTRRHAL